MHVGVAVKARTLAVAASLTALGAGCARSQSERRAGGLDGASPSAWLVVTTTPDRGVDLARVSVEGAGVRHVTLSGGTLAVEIDARRGTEVTVTGGGGCPLRVPSGDLHAGVTLRRYLSPWVDVGEPLAQVGFDAPFAVTAQPGCSEARAGSIAWRQVSGLPLRDTRVDQDGFRFSARTVRLEDALGERPAWGIVPLSPRTRGEAVLEATWQASGASAASAVTRRVRVSAAARARGLPNVVVGARLYVGGEGWHVVSAPTDSHAAVSAEPGFAAITPDVRGTFTLGDTLGHPLRIVAGKYDETPLDCGRSDCHSEVARIARSSPMATVLQRGLDAPFGGDYPACANGCHTLGEPGLDDGGFARVAHALGRSFPDLARGGFHDLPSPLQRLGGVGCLACHGPGAIPEANGRHALVRTDVCATCHDSPPRYGHVQAWRTSRMARADQDPRTREEPCARCHTTWGALGHREWRAPAEAAPAGIACAACHAVHPAALDTPVASGAPGAPIASVASATPGAPLLGQTCAEALPRELAMPAILADSDSMAPRAKKSRVCLSCHAPLSDEASPSGTAAVIWGGRGGVDPATGTPLTGPSPHGAVEGGCVGCHHDGPAGLEHGTNHGFLARRDRCKTCHGDKSDVSIRARAERLFDALGDQ
ncbi:MAG TPA: multiheme c-type cytochrome, partial [Polyangiaceae bacterium]